MKRKPLQQGDVLFRPISGRTRTAKPTQKGGRIVLAEGEATGHAHVVEDDEAELIREGERLLLRLFKQTTVKHDEHTPLTIGPGLWEIGRVREFDYLSMVARRVTD